MFIGAEAVSALDPCAERGGSLKPKHVRMYTRVGCEDSSAARDFLREQGVPFEEVDIDKNPETLAFVMVVNDGKQRTPTFNVDGHTFHCSPFDPRKLVRELRLERTGSTPRGAGKG
jgi:glutaredoxin